MTQAKTKVAIWLRASDPSQHPENQLPELRAWAERRGFEVVNVYTVQESAWKGAHQKALTQVYQDARAGRFQILLVWALDRLSREGVAATLEIIERLGRWPPHKRDPEPPAHPGRGAGPHNRHRTAPPELALPQRYRHQ